MQACCQADDFFKAVTVTFNHTTRLLAAARQDPLVRVEIEICNDWSMIGWALDRADSPINLDRDTPLGQCCCRPDVVYPQSTVSAECTRAIIPPRV